MMVCSVIRKKIFLKKIDLITAGFNCFIPERFDDANICFNMYELKSDILYVLSICSNT